MEISIKWNICRVCLQEELDTYNAPPGGHMHYLFDDNSEKFAKEIYECAGLTIRPDDNLPQKICHHCLTILRYAVNFRKTCRESEEYLQSVIERTKSASALFELDRRQKYNLHFLDKNDENSIPYYDSDEGDSVVDSQATDYVKIDTKKRKSRSHRFSGRVRKYTKRSLDLPTRFKLLPIKENDSPITETNIYKEEEVEDDTNEIIIDKDNDGKSAENEDIKVNEDENEEENDATIVEDKVVAETFDPIDPNTAEHSQKYEEEEEMAENHSNETCMESMDYNDNSLSPNTCDFANWRDFITKLTSTESNMEEDFITEESDDEHDDDNPDSDNTVKEDDYNDDLIEANENIENAKNETTKQEDEEDEERIHLEAFEEFENVEVTPTSPEYADEKHDDDNQYFDEFENVEVTPTSLEYADEKHDDDNQYFDEFENVEVTPTSLEYADEKHDDDNQYFDEFENVEVTPTSLEYADEKHDDDNQDFEEEEDALKISYADREACEADVEFFLPDIDENDGAKGDENAAKHESVGEALSQRSLKKEEDNANDDGSPMSCAMLCDICGNTFASRFLLNIHLRTHRQEKPHECELCFKRFTSACYLQAHMRVHTGEKNFDCRFCGRRSTDRSTHIRHERPNGAACECKGLLYVLWVLEVKKKQRIVKNWHNLSSLCVNVRDYH
uniref:Protein krueppel n=1 Tax=Glossina pallidipes TaxID=7398 RepID=A0A1A9ZNX9_GLOPL